MQIKIILHNTRPQYQYTQYFNPLAFYKKSYIYHNHARLIASFTVLKVYVCVA